MACKTHLLLTLFAAAMPLSAAIAQPMPMAPAPAAGPFARYCLHVDPVTGSHVETVQCWTRDEWASQDVDLDREWARQGVSVIG